MENNTTTSNEAQILSGLKLAKEIQLSLKDEIKRFQEIVPDFTPGLAIIQVGDREDSNVYIRKKLLSAKQLGIKGIHLHYHRDLTFPELIKVIKRCNGDPTIHGIIVQMPLDSDNEMFPSTVTDTVIPSKDVDGLNTINQGKLAVGNFTGFVPCTPKGIMELLESNGINVEGKNAIVIGRSKIVGTPISELLKWRNATVTMCHSKTENLQEQVRAADIVIVAIGKANFVKGSWIKKGAVVIDCGINAVEEENTGKKKLVGDVLFEEVRQVAGFISPVPGGVGPLTVAMLMRNTVTAAKLALNQMLKWNLTILPLDIRRPVPSDIEIARTQEPKDIRDLAHEIGLFDSEIFLYGNKKAKLSSSIIDRLSNQKNGKYVVVAGITPTPLGEGKSTTTIGLVQALSAHCDVNSIACVRQPSQGPTFGIKGGAAGGGYSQVIPMDEFNLHLTGDLHAVTAANNLLAAQIDAKMFHEATQKDTALYDRLVPKRKGKRYFSPIQLRRLQKLGIDASNSDSLTEDDIKRFVRLNVDPDTITWNRVIDTNDRFLREITIGQSPTEKGHTRKTQFDITVASEIMAIVALSTDLKELKEKLGKIVVAQDKSGNDITADDMGATGAMAVLLRESLQPTLMQTLEGTPVLVHAGPFANIAHGCSSVIADQIALKVVGPNGVVVTEAGFGSDIGMEKFFNIKCRYSGCKPDAVVLVATVRAIKMHGGGPPVTAGIPLKPAYTKENVELVKKGCCNLQKHIYNAKLYGIPVVVAINTMLSDTELELQIIREACKESGADDVVVCTHWADGGSGAASLADSVLQVCKTENNNFKYLYELELPIVDKICKIAEEMYGTDGVEFTEQVSEKLRRYQNNEEYRKLPVCMAKTQLSLSGDPSLKGVPKNFKLPVKDAYVSAGAGFIVVIAGEISKMPGLPTRPSIYDVDLNTETGEIEGLF